MAFSWPSHGLLMALAPGDKRGHALMKDVEAVGSPSVRSSTWDASSKTAARASGDKTPVPDITGAP
ncbi:MAG: hypothetical protein ACRDV4_01405 [Acidimicrobiales bacterium]